MREEIGNDQRENAENSATDREELPIDAKADGSLFHRFLGLAGSADHSGRGSDAGSIADAAVEVFGTACAREADRTGN